VTGYTRRQLIRIDGDAGGGFHTAKWNLSGDAYQWIGGDGSSLLGLRSTRMDGWTRRLTLLYAWNLDLPMYPESLVVATSTGVHTLAESDQDVRCEQPVPDRPILCLATDGGSTRVWEFDGGQLVPLGELAGRVVPTDMTPTGEIVAWRDSDRLLIGSRPLAALVLPGTRDHYEYWQEWTTAGRTIGALVSDEENRTSIRTFGR